MNKKIKETLTTMTRKYGRDMVCAVIAFNFDIGIEAYDMDAEEVMACVQMDNLYETNDILSADFEKMLVDYGEEKVNDAMTEYMEDEDHQFEKVSENSTPTQPKNMVAGSPSVSAVSVAIQTTAPAAAPSSAPTTSTSKPVSNAVPVQTTSTAPSASAVSAVSSQTSAATATPNTVSSANTVVTGKNYPNPVDDHFETAFAKWDDLRNCVNDLEATEVVYTHDEDIQACNLGFDPVQPNLQVVAVDDSPIMVGTMAKSMQCSPDAVLSTMRSKSGTGLALKIGNRTVPIGFSAIPGMNDCAGLKPNGFARNWKASSQAAAERYNQQFSYGSAGVTVIERSEKVRAMCSARFAYGKFSDILDIFENFWHGKFPNGEVQNMYLSHTALRWQLNLLPYKAEIFRGFPELLKSGYNMVLMFATSNTADSAFRIMPGFQRLNSNLVVPLCRQEDAVRICHTAKGNFGERVSSLMDNILHSFDRTSGILMDAAQRMEDLKAVTIKNPYNTILRVMDECGVSKKQGMEAATNFDNSNGNKPVSAFDCFVVVMNAYSFICRDNPQNQEVQFNASLNVGKAAMLNWAQYDIPGKFAW